MEMSWNVLANGLDRVPVELEALQVHLEIMGFALSTAERGTIETCHNCLAVVPIIAMVAHNLESCGLH